MSSESTANLQQALWRIYRRAQPAVPWRDGANLPWDDPLFSERMLREHLDQGHGAASRQQPEILRQVDWLCEHLGLEPEHHILDITCGPGLYAVELARRGVQVTGIDFSPASIRHARALAVERRVDDHCRFIQADVRAVLPEQAGRAFDAALFLYGQLAVFTRAEAAQLLRSVSGVLRVGGQVAIELLDYQRIDKSSSTWWFTDDTGLWGEAPFLHLGERIWDNEQRASIDRFYVVDLQSGELQEVGLSDNGYETEEMLALLQSSGFRQPRAYPAWDGVELYDAQEWVVYIAEI